VKIHPLYFLTPIIALTLFSLWAVMPQANAQTALSSEQAISYQQSCVNNRDERMTFDTQKLFCECTAHHMMSSLTVEDLMMVQGDGQAARNAINKMMMNVYAPCMEFPVRDLIFGRCMENEYQVEKGICECLANKMADYSAEKAQKYLSEILRDNPNIEDPMGPIVNHASFRQHEKRLALSCIQEGMQK